MAPKKNPAAVSELQKLRDARKAKRAAFVERTLQERQAFEKKIQEEAAKRGEAYEKEYSQFYKSEVAAQRKAKLEGAIYVPGEKKVALVVRIRGINKHSPRVIRILRLLRLRQINNAVFVRVNKASVNLLRKVEPFIMYGYPSVATIRKLIYKRGFLKVNRQRIPITSNLIVHEALKRKPEFQCVEDLVHEITTVGPNFKVANNTLWPFKLRNPRGGFAAKRHPFVRGGDWGNREDLINEIVQRML